MPSSNTQGNPKSKSKLSWRSFPKLLSRDDDDAQSPSPTVGSPQNRDAVSNRSDNSSAITRVDSLLPIGAQGSIWDLAYDALKQQDPKLMDGYENLLKSELLKGTGPSALPLASGKGVFDLNDRRSQLEQLAQQGLKVQQTKGRLYIAGHAIPIKEILLKLSEGVNLNKGWIDSAVGSSASPQAAVAWSIVCLALPLLTKPALAEKANKEGFVYVSSRMQYYIAMEDLLFPGSHSEEYKAPKQTTKAQLTSLYSHILNFQIRSILRCHQGILQAISNDFRSEYDWTTLQSIIRDLEASLYKDLQLSNSSESRHLLTKLEKQASVTHDALLRNMEEHLEVSKSHRDISSKLQDTSHEILKSLQQSHVQDILQQESDCLQSFCLEPSYNYFKGQIQDSIPGTCQWFLSHHAYATWLAKSDGVLLVSADPGAGKSVLAKHLIDKDLPQPGRNITICYFFFIIQLQDKLNVALCALLHQLLSANPGLLKHAIPEFLKHGSSLKSNNEKLFEILCNAANDPNAPPTIFVLDALDECETRDCHDFLRMLKRMQLNTQPNEAQFKFLITSRPYDKIIFDYEATDANPIASRVHIPGEAESEIISQEINQVIKHRLQELYNRGRLSDEVRIQLEHRFLAQSHRTYLWVYLVFDELQDTIKPTLKESAQIIDTLSSNVHEAYEKILSRSTKDRRSKEYAWRTICVMLAAEQPLSLFEIQIAVKIDLSGSTKCHEDLDLQDTKDFAMKLRNWCGLFIQIHRGQVTFLHQTARDFLLGNSYNCIDRDSADFRWGGAVAIQQAHAVLAHVCLTYLSFEDLKILEGIEGNDSFLTYAATNWDLHFQGGALNHQSEPLRLAEAVCNPTSPSFHVWGPLRYWPDSGWRNWCNSLSVAVALRSETLLGVLLGPAQIPNLAQDGAEALLIACKRRAVTYVKMLLAAGVDANGSDKLVAIPLCSSVVHGHVSVVETLLDNGANINQRDKYGMNAIYAATSKGKLDILKILIDRGADINSTSRNGWSCLFYAIKFDSYEAAEILLQNGALVDLQIENGTSAMHLAAQKNDSKYLRLLIEHSANVNVKDLLGQTPLHVAAKRGEYYSVKGLFERKQKIKAPPSDHGHNIVILLRNGADIDARDNFNNTALHAAIKVNRLDAAQALLQEGIDVNSWDCSGTVALKLAVLNGSEEAVRLLLSYNADVTIQDESGHTASYYVNGDKKYVIQELLLQYSPKIILVVNE